MSRKASRTRDKWNLAPLGEVCREGGGSIQTGPFGSQLHADDYKDDGVPIITVEHLREGKITNENLPLVGARDYQRLIRYNLAKGDLVFSRVGSIDRCSFVTDEQTGWLFSGRCLRVRPGRGRANPRFLSFLLNSWRQRQWILNQSVGSTMPCLNTAILSGVPIDLPPVDEQQRIADILSTVAEAIEQTEALIRKMQQMKAGLMHDLFTRGVTADGHLRPTRTEAPHLYKTNSVLGWLPKDWEMVSLGKLATSMTNGFVGTATPFYSDADDAVLYLYGNNVRVDKLELPTALRVTRHFHDSQRKSQLETGDMLTVQSGHIGTSAIVPAELGDANCHALIITKFNKGRVVPNFASRYCNSPIGFGRLRSIFVGSTIMHINVKDFKHFTIPLPLDLAEQELICRRVAAADMRLEFESIALAKLRQQKQGLMHDLLTGKVRTG